MCAYVQPQTVVVQQPGAPQTVIVAAPPQRSGGGALTAAGVLNLLTAIFGFIIAFYYVIIGSVFFIFGGFLLYICAALVLIGAIFALIGAVYCFKKQSYGMCIAGSILGMLFGGTFIFSLIALILVIVGKDGFVDEPMPPPPMMYAQPQPMVVVQQPQPVYQQPVYQQPPPQQSHIPPAGFKYCSTCGNQIAQTAPACPRCGAPAK